MLERIADGVTTIRFCPAEEFSEADVDRLNGLAAAAGLEGEDEAWLDEFRERVLRCILAPSLGDTPEKLNKALVSPRDQVSAMRELSRVGFNSTISLDDVRERLEQTITLAASRPTWESVELIAALDRIWR